jgi:hypothetical protein
MLLAGCGTHSPEAGRTDVEKLKLAFDRTLYSRTLDQEKSLVAETRRWLAEPLETRRRAFAGSEADRLARRFSATYTGYNVLRARLREYECSTAEAGRAKQRVLDHLYWREMMLHKLGEFLYGAARHGFPYTPPGRLPAQIVELRWRIAAHPSAVDEATVLLANVF